MCATVFYRKRINGKSLLSITNGCVLIIILPLEMWCVN